MCSNRRRLWDAETSAAYWKEADAAAQRATAAKYGENTAREIHALWPELMPDERGLLELLLLEGRRSLIAPFDDELCNALVARRLLQVPAGVGTVLMQDLETTFKVPRAVWRELNEHRDRFVPCADATVDERLTRLRHLSQRYLLREAPR